MSTFKVHAAGTHPVMGTPFLITTFQPKSEMVSDRCAEFILIRFPGVPAEEPSCVRKRIWAVRTSSERISDDLLVRRARCMGEAQLAAIVHEQRQKLGPDLVERLFTFKLEETEIAELLLWLVQVQKLKLVSELQQWSKCEALRMALPPEGQMRGWKIEIE